MTKLAVMTPEVFRARMLALIPEAVVALQGVLRTGTPAERLEAERLLRRVVREDPNKDTRDLAFGTLYRRGEERL